MPILLDTAVAGGSGNLAIDNAEGLLQVNNLQAANNQIAINAGSVSEATSDSAADLTATQILLQTSDGIGTNGKASISPETSCSSQPPPVTAVCCWQSTVP